MQSVSITQARSTTTATTSVMSSHTFKFWGFQRLHKIGANNCFCSTGNTSINTKIASTEAEIAWWIWDKSPDKRHTWIANGQVKNKCARSSWVETQLTQCKGHCTPLSWSRILVGKQPLHILQTKFWTLGGTLSFQIPDQLPGRRRWEESKSSSTQKR